MAIYQEAFDLSGELLEGVLSGKYKVFGGVVRYAAGPNKGQIVKHLKPVDLDNAQQAKNLAVNVAKQLKGNTPALVAVGAAAAAAIGTGIYFAVKGREPKAVKEFRSALGQYLASIRNGDLSLDEIENLSEQIQELKKRKDYDDIRITLTAQDLGTIVARLSEYTAKLAKDNGVTLGDEYSSAHHSEDVMANLEVYLNAQRCIFELAA